MPPRTSASFPAFGFVPSTRLCLSPWPRRSVRVLLPRPPVWLPRPRRRLPVRLPQPWFTSASGSASPSASVTAFGFALGNFFGLVLDRCIAASCALWHPPRPCSPLPRPHPARRYRPPSGCLHLISVTSDLRLDFLGLASVSFRCSRLSRFGRRDGYFLLDPAHGDFGLVLSLGSIGLILDPGFVHDLLFGCLPFTSAAPASSSASCSAASYSTASTLACFGLGPSLRLQSHPRLRSSASLRFASA